MSSVMIARGIFRVGAAAAVAVGVTDFWLS